MTRIEVPDIGDYKNIPVIEVLVGVGQRVEREQSLVVLESDKATMDVPSPAAGGIREMKVAVGETVSQGTLIALLDSDGERQDDAGPVPATASAALDRACPSANVATGLVPALAPAPELESASAPLHRAPAREGEPSRASHASPSVRKFARELGVDVARVPGSGPKGRITKDDITGFVK
ncbi:biotin/lipoyl-containing protein, partial [Burkholderia vietnamiensis]|uniref:biotin/lipoyl-containing protein n=1 Tax=Burkholderia vietnamiensis TaxID=60552 RepID=UPI00351E7C91